MAPFQYDRYVSPYTNNIAELIQRQGEIPAQAALRVGDAQAGAALARGNAWAGAAQNAGQAVSGAIQQATDPRRKLEAQQLIEAKQRTADLQAFDKAFQQPGGRDAVLNALPGHLRPTVMKQFTDADTAAATVQETQLKAESATTSYVQTLAEISKAHNYDPIAMQFSLTHAKQTFQNNPSLMGQINQFESALHADPSTDTVRAIVDPILSAKDAQEKAQVLPATPRGGAPAQLLKAGKVVATGLPAPEATPNETELALKAAGGDPAAAMRILKPGPKQSIEEEWMARDRRLAVAKNGGQPLTDAQLKAVDTASMQDFAQSKADPAMRDAALAQKNIATLLAQAQLNQQPTPEQARSVAEDMVNHRIAPEQLASLFSTRGKEGLAFKLAVTSAAKQLDPTFNFEEASASYNLVKSAGFQNTVRYMDSVLESMPRLLENAKKLGNGDWRSWNQLANATKGQFNDTDLKRLKTDAVLVGDEVAKILSGGGTGSTTSDAKLKQGMDIISQSDSVPAMAAALDEIQTLIGYRRKAQTRGTYMEGTSAVKPTVLKLVNGKLVPE